LHILLLFLNICVFNIDMGNTKWTDEQAKYLIDFVGKINDLWEFLWL
jgi:hypothetical protein